MLTQHSAGHWRTSSYSGGNNCVEVSGVAGCARVRDTKNRSAGYFTISSQQWSSFVSAIKMGRYDICA
ncbi:DUF397 domain-containing protein [Saccharopolyspora sp. SCSIO 74807]|uniref:DUF397 domain-containing protein n=1 Tax=Saccharopolyspora sp. SCSIO 74807 TaxID=3118084 RepID=UPI0030CC114D